MAGRFSVDAVFRAVDRITAPVTRMQNRVGRFSRSMEGGFRRLNRSVDGFARGMRRGAIAVTAALAMSGAAMAGVIGTGAEFEQTLVNAAVKFPGEIRKGTVAFKELEDAARRTGSTTEFTAVQSANALNFLAMAGFDAENAIAALPGIVNLATAAQVDLATASDIATDSLGAFNMLSKDAATNQANLARVSDIYAAATTSANMTMEEMFETLKQGAPVGVAAGQTIETIATLTAKMADAGIKGQKAGTGLKNIFLSLNAPGSTAAKVMRRLGIETADADGNIRDAIDVFQDFSKATAKLPQQSKMQVFNEIFGRIPLAAAINLTNAADSMHEFRAQMENATGASTKMADVMRDTVQGRLNSLKSAVEGVKISIFSLNEGPLADAIERTTDWTRANEDLIASNIGGWLAMVINNFENIVKWGKRVATAVAVFVAFSLVLKTFIMIMTAVNLAMALNPVTWIVIGVIALIAAIVALGAYLWSIRDTFIQFGKTIVDKVIAGIVWLKDAFLGLPGPVQAAIALMMGPIGWIAGAAALIKANWGGITEFFGDLWGGVTDIFDASLAKIMAVVDAVKNAASAIVDRVASIGGGVASFFGFGGGDEEEAQGKGGATGPQVVSPQERTARSIEETRTSSAAEVTIRDDTGRAEVTRGFMGPGVSLQPSGGF